MKNNHFKIIIPVRNAEEHIARCLYSVWSQTYQDWSAIIIDDVSTDNTVEEINRFLLKFESIRNKVTVIINSNRQYALSNILTGIRMSNDNDIVCHVDGDDWLCDMDAFTLINQTYKNSDKDVGAVWTNHRWGFSPFPARWVGAIPKGANPYEYPWVSSHLKTFRKYLINEVNNKNFYNESNKYFQRIADQAFYLPVLEICRQKDLLRVFLPICAYHYNISQNVDFQSDDSKLQLAEALFLRKRGFIK